MTANGQSLSFLTLTSHEQLTVTGSLKVWPKAWKKLRQRANYKLHGFQYILIPERHKSGKLHIHALETGNFGQKWWKDNGRECGLGYIANEGTARTAGGAAMYVTKYLTKSLESTVWPKGLRRIRTTRSWPQLPTPEPLPDWQWQIIPQNVQVSDLIGGKMAQGWIVEQFDHQDAWKYLGAMAEHFSSLDSDSAD